MKVSFDHNRLFNIHGANHEYLENIGIHLFTEKSTRYNVDISNNYEKELFYQGVDEFNNKWELHLVYRISETDEIFTFNCFGRISTNKNFKKFSVETKTPSLFNFRKLPPLEKKYEIKTQVKLILTENLESQLLEFEDRYLSIDIKSNECKFHFVFEKDYQDSMKKIVGLLKLFIA